MTTLKIEVELDHYDGVIYGIAYNGKPFPLSDDDLNRAIKLMKEIAADTEAERKLDNLHPSSLTGYYVECAK